MSSRAAIAREIAAALTNCGRAPTTRKNAETRLMPSSGAQSRHKARVLQHAAR